SVGSPYSQRGARPELSVRDLEDIATALGSRPAALLVNDIPAEQLDLPFTSDSAVARLEVECMKTGLRIRPVPTAQGLPEQKSELPLTA
ncbi:MAG TPA: hypothetical protein VI685_05255, partial [Candidatus Angelobacter sp.]